MSVIKLYDHHQLETKWLARWEEAGLFQQTERQGAESGAGDPLYLLFAFAYPSGSGLHVGHVESKTALDILARYYRMQGRQVFFPVGWDAFGLPAENYAIKTGVPPAQTTKQAIDTFRRQIKRLAISYDWANEIATCHPGYYRWTQWLFLKLFEAGLAYKKAGQVNWCDSCQTVLANEQVVDGACERCDTPVVQKEMDQWFFKISAYRDELISGLDEVDWPEATKQQQLNWIGKKEGAEITYPVVDESGQAVDRPSITCFTTRPDTNFGATFVVIAPEHDLARELAADNPEVADYLERSAAKTELERQREGKKKTGVFTGLYALNRLTDEPMPIWISDFVLAGFGTGAVVGVPGHDTRDFEFAQTFDLPVRRVVAGPDRATGEITELTQVFEDEGQALNSGFLDGLETAQAQARVIDHLEEKGWGKRVTTYRLRDWLISRQRYWGAPIPILYDPEGGVHLVPEAALPWELPTDVDYNPKGVSPLASSSEFRQRAERVAAEHFADLIAEKGWDAAGKGWQPEYDTMDTFVDSSWYFLRYPDARNERALADPAQLEKWLPVDFYMIGPEHIVLHLLYSRFFTKFLRDQGLLGISEPFAKMRHQGMILGPDHRKMSKSKGNVINPDDIIDKFGADTLRVYEMFMGPIEADKPWDTRAVVGVYKFLQRANSAVVEEVARWRGGQSLAEEGSQAVRRKLHQTIAKVTRDIREYKYNTAIAALMEFLNLFERSQRGTASRLLEASEVVALVKLLAPLAPFLAEELYAGLVEARAVPAEEVVEFIHLSNWPEFDEDLAREEKLIIPVQVNGKVRAQLEVSAEVAADEAQVLELSRTDERVARYLSEGELVREVYIAGKIVSLAVR